jgi:YcaO-like protein with predicted kinase domain
MVSARAVELNVRPYSLESPASKGFRAGTHRLCAPGVTVERVSRLMPVMGITRIANVTGLDCIGIPVVTVCRPNSRSIAVSQGKGLDLDAARASGLMESVEGYHAERIMLPLRLCGYEELRYTYRVVDVAQLPRRLGEPGTGEWPHDGQRPMLWIEGNDLLHDETVWLPYEMVHTNYTLASRDRMSTFVASSNGLASGNHLLEAISHAICEVVERDAATLWALQSDQARRSTLIDLKTVEDPDCLSVLAKLDHAGVAIAAWEITSDVGIPAFQCVIVQQAETDIHRLPPSTGTGCHPTREVALLRALTEAVQARLTAITGSRDDMSRDVYEALTDADAFAEQHQLVMAGCGRKSFRGFSRESDTFDEDVKWELGQLSAAGIERVVVVNLTKQELGVPVVRVVIPGLEPSHRHTLYRYGRRALRIIESHR